MTAGSGGKGGEVAPSAKDAQKLLEGGGQHQARREGGRGRERSGGRDAAHNTKKPEGRQAREDVEEEEEVEEEVEEQDLVKKKQQELLSQDVWNNVMKEMANEYTAETVTSENLSILLFMTQKAISDLKLLKSIFDHRKYSSYYS